PRAVVADEARGLSTATARSAYRARNAQPQVVRAPPLTRLNLQSSKGRMPDGTNSVLRSFSAPARGNARSPRRTPRLNPQRPRRSRDRGDRRGGPCRDPGDGTYRCTDRTAQPPTERRGACAPQAARRGAGAE